MLLWVTLSEECVYLQGPAPRRLAALLKGCLFCHYCYWQQCPSSHCTHICGQRAEYASSTACILIVNVLWRPAYHAAGEM